ncbi:hypothetical protein TSAR_001981, partial [Trichomalopsis sarcophagae]
QEFDGVLSFLPEYNKAVASFLHRITFGIRCTSAAQPGGSTSTTTLAEGACDRSSDSLHVIHGASSPSLSLSALCVSPPPSLPQRAYVSSSDVCIARCVFLSLST